MTGLQSPCRVQCTCRRYSSYVFEGKCYFLFVAAGSVLSFLCRLEAISLVSGACSQQPAGPSQATSTVKRLSGSYDTGSPRDTRKPSLRNGAPAGPAVGEGHLDCWLHRAWGNRKVPGNAPALQVSSEPLPGRSSQALHPAGVGRSHRRCLSRAFQERKTCLTWKAMPAGLVLEGAGGPRGPAGEEGLCRPPPRRLPSWALPAAARQPRLSRRHRRQPRGKAARNAPESVQAANRAAETSDSQWLFFAFEQLR